MSHRPTAFNRAAGAGKSAYLALDSIFAGDPPLREGWQFHKDRYEELQARKWLTETDAQAAPIVAQMQHHLRRQAEILHEPSRNIDALLKRAEAEIPNLDEWEGGNLARMRHIYTHQSGLLDQDLVQRYEETLAAAEHDWIETLDIDDAPAAFAAQKAPLENALALIRETVAEPARRMGVKPSEAALDLLNPGVTNAMIDTALAKMKPGYPALVAAIQAQDNVTPPPLPVPDIPAPVQQRIFSRIRDEMLAAAGWDDAKIKAAGVTIAPLQSTQTGFCWGSNKDITLSIETTEDKLYLGLGNTWHEVGHMLYLLNMSTLPPQAQGRPVGQFNGFGVHETAAMFMEQAGLRLKAMQLVAPIIHDELAKAKAAGELPPGFNVNDPGLSAANLHAQANRPKLDDMEWGTSELALPPNMAWRTLALRKLIDNEMAVDDLPQFWADTMTDWTGTDHDPADFRIGESHIFEGLGGYFYAYLTGAFNAAEMQRQIAPAAAAADTALPAGADLSAYVKLYSDTLKTRIFDNASKYSALDTLSRAIGGRDPNDPAAYMARLTAAAQDNMPAPDMLAAGTAPPRAKPGPRPDGGTPPA